MSCWWSPVQMWWLTCGTQRGTPQYEGVAQHRRGGSVGRSGLPRPAAALAATGLFRGGAKAGPGCTSNWRGGGGAGRPAGGPSGKDSEDQMREGRPEGLAGWRADTPGSGSTPAPGACTARAARKHPAGRPPAPAWRSDRYWWTGRRGCLQGWAGRCRCFEGVEQRQGATDHGRGGGGGGLQPSACSFQVLLRLSPECPKSREPSNICVCTTRVVQSGANVLLTCVEQHHGSKGRRQAQHQPGRHARRRQPQRAARQQQRQRHARLRLAALAGAAAGGALREERSRREVERGWLVDTAAGGTMHGDQKKAHVWAVSEGVPSEAKRCATSLPAHVTHHASTRGAAHVPALANRRTPTAAPDTRP